MSGEAGHHRRPAVPVLVMQVAGRLGFAACLVFATYNPSGLSLAHWLLRGDAGWPWKVAAAGVVAVIQAITLRAAARAVGVGGAAFCITVASSLAWVMMQSGLLVLSGAWPQIWFLLSVAAFVLGVGLSWVLIAGAFDGQLRTIDLTS